MAEVIKSQMPKGGSVLSYFAVWLNVPPSAYSSDTNKLLVWLDEVNTVQRGVKFPIQRQLSGTVSTKTAPPLPSGSCSKIVRRQPQMPDQHIG